MKKFATILLMSILMAQCPTCPKVAVPIYAQTGAPDTAEKSYSNSGDDVKLPYEFVISRSADDFVPALSGATFAIATLSNDKLDIELAFRVGQRLTYSKLTDDAPIDFRPVWIENGQSILFDSARDKMIAIWKLTLSRGEPELFIKPEKDGMCFGASPSPDEKKIAYTRTNFINVAWWTIYIVPPVTNVSPEQFQIVIRDIEDGSDRILTYGMMPSWSPDGSKIAYSLFDGASWSIWVADAETGQRNQITNTRESDISPAWSPDGEWIAFCRVNNESKSSDIWAVRGDGTSLTQLTNTPTRGEGGPCWTQDGIYFHTDAGEGTPYDIAMIAKEKIPLVSAAATSAGSYATKSKSSLKIQVLNSTKISGLAARTASLLKKNGYNVADIGNSKRERNLYKGKIYYKPGLKEQARKIAELIPGVQLLKMSKKFRYDIVVVLGRNTKY